MPQPFKHADLANLASLQPEGWAPIEPPFRTYLEQDFAHPHKIEREGSLAAIGNLTRFGASGWLSQIITHPQHRGQGLGSRMVAHLLELAGRHGAATVSLIATAEGRPLYKKAGFEDEEEYVFFRTPPTPPAQAWERGALRPASPLDHAGILDLDARASGEMRGAVLAPHLGGTWVCGEPGRLRGFWMPGLREGLVVALDPEAGATLLAAKAQAGGRMVMPAANVEARDCAASLGYVEASRAWRMVRGARLHRAPTLLWSRIAGKLG